MIAVFGMCMIVNPAGFVVDHMGYNNANYSKGQEDYLVFMPNLLGKQKGDTCHKKPDRG